MKIDREAKDDISRVFEWYYERDAEVAELFFTEVFDHIDRLAEHPYFQIRYDHVRCLPLNRFPYSIHFTIKGSNVTVHAIIAHKEGSRFEEDT